MTTFNPDTDLDITGLERWEVLRALHRATTAHGIGVLHDKEMTELDAKELIAEVDAGKFRRFDYIYGRPMKIGFGPTWITRVDLYDRDSLVPAYLVVAQLRHDKKVSG